MCLLAYFTLHPTYARHRTRADIDEGKTAVWRHRPRLEPPRGVHHTCALQSSTINRAAIFATAGIHFPKLLSVAMQFLISIDRSKLYQKSYWTKCSRKLYGYYIVILRVWGKSQFTPLNHLTEPSNVRGPKNTASPRYLFFHGYLAVSRRSVAFRIYLGLLLNAKIDWGPSVWVFAKNKI